MKSKESTNEPVNWANILLSFRTNLRVANKRHITVERACNLSETDNPYDQVSDDACELVEISEQAFVVYWSNFIEIDRCDCCC